MATQSKIIYLPRFTVNDSVKLISVICWHAKKCPCIAEKKKNLLSILHKKSISVGSQNDSDLWNLSHFCWQHFTHWRAGNSASIPRHLAHSPVAACLAAGHIHCLEVTEKWRCFIWGKGLVVWGVHMAHSTTISIFPNPCWITSQREACKTCSALCKKKPTFPDCSNSITAKHNT